VLFLLINLVEVFILPILPLVIAQSLHCSFLGMHG
jgi:hypothetical protein